MCTMTAQVWGITGLPPSGGQLAVFPLISRWSVLGNSVFMLSDTLLALDKFVSPLPYAGLWVLASYYVAQGLMYGGSRGPQIIKMLER